MTQHDKSIYLKALTVVVLIVLTFSIKLLIKESNNIESYLIERNDSDIYVSHGEITTIPESVCYEGSPVETLNTYYYHKGKLYNTDFPDPVGNFFIDEEELSLVKTRTSLVHNSKTELITIIDEGNWAYPYSQDGRKNEKRNTIKVPLNFNCSTTEHKIASFNSNDIPQIMSVPITPICENGELISPYTQISEFVDDISSSVITTKVTKSASLQNWVISNTTVEYFDHLPVTGETATRIPPKLKTKNGQIIDVNLTCKYNKKTF